MALAALTAYTVEVERQGKRMSRERQVLDEWEKREREIRVRGGCKHDVEYA